MPSVVPTQQPAIADIKSCEAWLARAALSDPKQACRELTGLLESLEEVPPAESALVEVLERLREPIVVAQAEHAKRYAGRPLPLKDFEIAAFEQVFDLWTTLGRAYRRLLRSAVEDLSPDLAGKEALLAQRALDCVGELMLVHYRARREIDNELWLDLHQLYRTAETHGLTLQTVSAGYRSKSVSTCAEVYVRSALLSLANPYALGTRELAWTRRWATMWAYKVDLAPAAEDGQGYAVDLDGVPRNGEPAPQRPEPHQEARFGSRPADPRPGQGLRAAGGEPAALHAGARVDRGARVAAVHAPACPRPHRARERLRVDPSRGRRQGVQERRAALGLHAPRR
jgi:hypothetical protein